MIINDKLYGEFILDPVLEELILSEPVQRLKGIHQGGASFLVNEKWSETRFDHSVGVMLLIRKLGGSLEEQIAGLLHDVSHTAFSHVIDFVFDNKEEDYHEKIYSSVVKNSEIPTILATFNYNYEDLVLDDSKWTLLEQPAPELCADRVDYTLRDMYTYGIISLDEVQDFLKDILVIEGKMYLQNIEVAEWFVETYYKEVIDFFMDPLNVYAYDMLAKTLKRSLEKNILNVNDFLKRDGELLNKIKASNDKELLSLLRKLNSDVEVIEDRENYELHRKNKLRMIDPSILKDGDLISASRLSEKVRILGEVAYEKATRGMYVKIISN
ncbi:deoxyguanosinetriphosphate triphosphohydrolase [Halalkalibacter wakoensis JCM 9140]|uniref:Deoxyguanosinetriphosphate triphosphohydrolase n=1 Tax=Halalkalibacter wakoensis JCM 9140 TaxID=1236970 RepID=W4Q0L0_9BACI|nr:HD domain-containing protein [Halalkalibacter wakoensis]GAE25263.1 deoxyguanosinetriphosphate triphosphohydrolase [Halalkalibacter wakoensis JCM 9140]